MQTWLRASLPARSFAMGLCLALTACGRADADTTQKAPTPSAPAPSALPAPALQSAAAAGQASGPELAGAPLSADEFSRLFTELSEPDRYFFSNNYVSNETSYLDIAGALETRARKGGAYIGVGPEQNFTYIALTAPRLAFIVDIRRANAVELLLYKAVFDLATSRAHFLSLLVGRPYSAEGAPGESASIEEVLAFVDKTKRDKQVFADTSRRVRDKIKNAYKVSLTAADLETLGNTERAFFDKQLDLSFELLEQNGRKYPTFRALLSEMGPDGVQRGFLTSEAAFQRVQRLQREHRIVPVVGDFAGSHALAKIGAELRRRDLPVSVFYVSNVEQYLMEPDKWQAWVKNIEGLPSNEQSLFVRCYLDQGKKHPAQRQGHRTATVLMSFDHFKWRQKSKTYRGFWELATDVERTAKD